MLRLSLTRNILAKQTSTGYTKEFGLSWSRMGNDKRKEGPDSTNYRFNKFARPPFPFGTDPWDGKGPPPHILDETGDVP